MNAPTDVGHCATLIMQCIANIQTSHACTVYVRLNYTITAMRGIVKIIGPRWSPGDLKTMMCPKVKLRGIVWFF